MRSPLTFAWRNVVFAEDADDPWAIYRVHMQSYVGLSTADKLAALGSFAAFASSIEADFQLLRVHRGWAAEDYETSARSTVDARRARAGWIEHLIAQHRDAVGDGGPGRPELFLAVRLASPRGRAQHGPFRAVRAARQLLGFADPAELSQRELDAVLDDEARAFGRAGDLLDLERISTRELQWLLRRAACRGVTEPWLDEFWRPQALVMDADDEDGGRRLQPLDATMLRLIDEPIREERSRLEIGATQQTFLVAGALPEVVAFPGHQAELMFAPVEALDFPVDVCFAARWIPNGQALALVRRKIVDADHAYTEESYGEHGPTSTTATRPDVARELEEQLTASDRPPLLRGQLCFALGAGSQDELDARVRRLRREYAPVALHRPKDIQLDLWRAHFPGQLPRHCCYDDVFLPEQLGAMVPSATHAVGARIGLLIGHTLSGSRQPVLFDVTEGSRTSRPPAVLCTGTLGSGKTLTAQLLALHAFAAGSRVIDLDPKGDHHLPDVVGRDDVEQVELSADGRHKGLLDPLRIAPDDLRVELAHSFLTELLPAPVPGEWQTEIRAAVREVVDGGGRSCGLVVDRLRGAGAAAGDAARAIEIHAESGLLQLAFADAGAPVRAPEERPVVSLRIANLTLPVPGTPKADLSAEERTGRALLRLLAVQALHFASSDWSQHKLLVIEELSQLVGDAIGLTLVQRIVRLCRSQNATPVLVTQVVDDVAAVSDLVGCFFAFGVETNAEAARVLTLLGLDADDAQLRAQLRAFRRGRCLLRDYDGRISPVQVEPGAELLHALDTTPGAREALDVATQGPLD